MLKEVSIEITRKCPNKCVHCSSMSSLNCNEIIPFSVFKNFIDSASKLNLKNICLSGGEPFLHPNLIDFIKYASEKKIQVIIYSSGIYYNEANQYTSIPNTILKSIAPYLTKIIFNIEAVTEEIYDKIMGTRNCFPLLKESIQKSLSYNIECEAHTVPMKLNINELKDIITFCNELGISKVSFLRLVPHGRAKNNLDILLSDKELHQVKELVNNIQHNNNNKIRVGVPLQFNTENYKCEAAQGKLNIKYDGYVYPCEVFKNMDSQLMFGDKPKNIFDNNLDEIYLNSAYLISVRKKLNDFYQLKDCDNCGGQFLLNNIKE